jgi:hypothetical protein
MASMKPLDWFLCLCFTWLCLSPLAIFGRPLSAETTDSPLAAQYQGALGTMQAGMTLIVKDETITSGHYFTSKDLSDIPITGAIHDRRITVAGTDGSEFELRFKSDGSEHGEHLRFGNTVGLVGTRQFNGKVEKVDFGILTMGQSAGECPECRSYAFTTDLSDAEFESFVRNWRVAVLSGNRKAAAKYTHFPLRVNVHRRHKRIRTPEDLSTQWDRIFTPKYLSRIKKDLPHDMLGENSSLLVMLGPGDVWFGDKGIEILNLPD